MAFGIDDAIAAGLHIIDKFVPDPQEKMKAEAALRDHIAARNAAQVDLDKAEVQSGSMLGKWRGALGWGLACSAIYQFMLHPVFVSVLLAFNPAFPVEKLPKLEWKELGSVLMGMLGLS